MIINKSEKEKREDIIAHADRSIFVEAGAGAGKTTLIIQRITNQIRQGVLKPEELVVITFTNKAAGELFERMQAAFALEETNEENTPEQKARFTYALEHLEQIHISTIHSFCFSILKERCFEAKLPLEVSLLENTDATIRQKKFFAKWFAALDKSQIDEIKKALIYQRGYAYSYGQAVEDVFLHICEKPQDINFVSLSDAQLQQLETEIIQTSSLEEQLLKTLNAEIQIIGQKGIEIYENIAGVPFYPETKGASPKCKTFYKYYQTGYPNENDSFNNKIPELYGDELVSFCNKGTKKADKETYSKINEQFHSWLNTVIRPNKTYAKWFEANEKKKELVTSYAYYVLMKYAIMGRTSYQAQLDDTELSNDQLIQKAHALVCHSQDARKYFAEKYKCIYVDEFQDTDHIQAELVWRLATDEGGNLKNGALFLVGDPKQAIYRFRGGEPAVYYQMKQRMSDLPEAEVYELDNNFRSNKEVIRWVNEQFKPVIAASGIPYRDMICTAEIYPEEQPTAPEKQSVLKGVYHLDALLGFQGGYDTRKAEHEATLLVRIIKELVSGRYYIYENSKENGSNVRKLRPIHYGDFLILCWSTTQMDYYIEKMKEYSIPMALAGKTDLNGSRVLRSFLALYRFLLQPYDKKSIQGAKQIVYHGEVADACLVADQRLEKLRQATKHLNEYAKAQYLLEHIEYLLNWNVEISKEEMYALQARLYQMIESVFALSKEKPEDILAAFENFIETKLEHELMLADQKSVRFMNLHKAKGLEGNITILTNRRGMKEAIPEYTSTEKNEDQQYDYYGSFSADGRKTHGYYYDSTTQVIMEKAIHEEEAEKIRLDYVAATRAKEVLIVTKAFSEKAPFSKYQIPEESSFYHVILPQTEENMENTVDTEPIGKETRIPYPVPTDEMKVPVYVTLTPSSLEGVVVEDAQGEENEPEWKQLTAEEREKFPRRPKGNVFGTTMHRSFELFIQQRSDAACDISACVHQAVIENAEELLLEGQRRYLKEGESKELYLQVVKEFLIKALHKFASDENMCDLLDHAKEIYTELPFSYYTSREEDPELFRAIQKHLDNHKIEIGTAQPVWVNGTADLVVVGADEKIHIIDFKSDSKYAEDIETFEKNLIQKYEGQLLLYKYSMSRIFQVDFVHISTELYHLY